jgi:phosphopantetheinyl transferase
MCDSVSRNRAIWQFSGGRQRELGVDLEHFGQASLDISGIPALLFREEEIAALNDIPSQRHKEAFLWIWTRLETQGKASGVGIGKLNSASDSFHKRYFSFARPCPSPGYVLALTVQGRRRCSLRAITFQVPPVHDWT